MAIKNIPKADDFYKKAESLFFEAFTALLNNIMFKNEHEFSKYVSPTESNNIVNLFHQSSEFFLKGKITETSPYLLISGLRSDDFIECYTLDAKDLIDVANKANNQFINKHISSIFEKYRKIRNKDTHSFSSIKMNDDLYNEYFFDFIDIYNLFGNNDFTSTLMSFLNLKYEKKMLNNKKNNFIEPSTYHSRYITLISSFINYKIKDKYIEDKTFLEKANRNNSKIFKLLHLPKNFVELKHFYCKKCSKNYYASFDQPSFDEIINFKEYNIETIYENGEDFICFCCKKTYKNDQIEFKYCKICSSIDKTEKHTHHYSDECISCNISLTSKNKTFLEYGLIDYKGNNFHKFFYQNFNKLFKDNDSLLSYFNEQIKIMLLINDQDIFFRVDPGTIKLVEITSASCSNFSLFYTMLIENKNYINDFYLKDSEKLEIYNNHKNIFKIEETILFAFNMYKKILKEVLSTQNIIKIECDFLIFLHKFNILAWKFIFDSIHNYYNIKINEYDYHILIEQYLGYNIYKDIRKFHESLSLS